MAGQVTPSVMPPVAAVLLLIFQHGELGNIELRDHLNINDRKHVHKGFITLTLEAGLIEMTIPDKPNSRLQKYRLTELGKAVAIHKNE